MRALTVLLWTLAGAFFLISGMIDQNYNAMIVGLLCFLASDTTEILKIMKEKT